MTWFPPPDNMFPQVDETVAEADDMAVAMIGTLTRVRTGGTAVSRMVSRSSKSRNMAVASASRWTHHPECKSHPVPPIFPGPGTLTHLVKMEPNL